MHTIKKILTTSRFSTLALAFLLSSSLLLGLSACGKKGPLYHAPAETASEEQPQNQPEEQKPD